MIPESVQSTPTPEPAPDTAAAAATSDPRVDALLQRAAHVQSLPVSEHKGHYRQLLDELTAELNADPGAAMAKAATEQAQP